MCSQLLCIDLRSETALRARLAASMCQSAFVGSVGHDGSSVPLIVGGHPLLLAPETLPVSLSPGSRDTEVPLRCVAGALGIAALAAVSRCVLWALPWSTCVAAELSAWSCCLLGCFWGLGWSLRGTASLQVGPCCQLGRLQGPQHVRGVAGIATAQHCPLYPAQMQPQQARLMPLVSLGAELSGLCRVLPNWQAEFPAAPRHVASWLWGSLLSWQAAGPAGHSSGTWWLWGALLS